MCNLQMPEVHVLNCQVCAVGTLWNQNITWNSASGCLIKFLFNKSLLPLLRICGRQRKEEAMWPNKDASVKYWVIFFISPMRRKKKEYYQTFLIEYVWSNWWTGPSCSKLTMSLVNIFKTLIIKYDIYADIFAKKKWD